ncbi:cytidylyltransferase domain-containing protein [Halapricum hydrolyticum]|uniref:Cytidyltransferase-like protein n=1 Tax=Halapricum hydrolyticum TaxID=2979991 RepID=A0AAE3LG87_9EURY|nr:cytidyltransferase-like protein [Halapricum hydrolyticum]MCU4719616.1 cytidyltransferase-like protein [Halapricum hydrolyticum]MCU4728535.1 cytidyltransferase-like protein [Halapricum hydrolyticum]
MAYNVLSVIPARKGSKGIPRKNLRQLGEDPLVAHAIKKSKKSNWIDHVALTTDSQEIAQIGRQYGVDTIIDRPTRLATDEIPLAPVIEHAFEEVDHEFHYVLCFQPTAPLVSVDSIDEGIEAGIDSNADSVVFVRDSTHIYWRDGENGYEPVASDRKNRQQMDEIYQEIGIFLSENHIVRQGRRVGDSSEFYEVGMYEGIDIDTYADWILAESQLQRKQVLYRLIGNGNAGTGHVYRGITIADRLFEHDVLFAVEATEDLAIEKLEESNYDYQIFENEPSFLDYVRSTQPDVVANDILDTSAEYIKSLKEYTSRVVNFEDLGAGTDHADAVINALYEHSNPPENHYFGFKYFCLRNEFRYADPRTAIPSVERIMISFGGTDENNLTAKTLRALSDLDHELHLDVVLGLGYTDQGSLDSVTATYPPNISVEINQNVQSMAEHMEQADLLITSNGRTLYEAGSLNVPVISIAQNHREQKHPYAHISRGVLFLGQAEYVTEENVRTAVEEYVTEREKRETMREALEGHDITNGVERIKQIMFNQNNAD